MSTTLPVGDDGAVVIDSAAIVGDTWDRHSLRLLDGAGVALPMTGATGVGEVVGPTGDSLATLTVEVDDDGWWTWRLEAEDSAAIGPVTASYYVTVTLPDGDVSTIVRGRLRLRGTR